MSTQSRVQYIYVNKGCEPPEAFLKLACDAYPSWNGLVMHPAVDGELIYSKDHEGAATPYGLLAIRKAEEYADKDILFILGKEEGSVKLDEEHANLQPWEIIELDAGGGKTVCKVLLTVDGVFEDMASNQAPEGRPFLLSMQKIIPFLQNLWTMSGNDVNKFNEHLRLPHWHDMILGLTGEKEKDVTIAIITAADERPFFWFSRSNDGDEYDWGFTNRTLGYKEPDSAVPAGNAGKPTLKMSGGPSTSATTADTSAPVMYGFRVNANIIKDGDRRALYIEYHGQQPNQYRTLPTVSLLPEKYQKASVDGRITVTTLAPSEAASAVKPATETASQIQNAALKEKLKKFVDANVLQVMSPEDMAANELPVPTFWDQSGWTLENFLNAKNRPAILKNLLKGAAFEEASFELIRDLCYAIFQLEKDLATATEPPKAEEPPASSPTGKRRIKMSGTAA